MNLFDTRTMTQNDRFKRALLIVIPLSILVGILYGLLNMWLGSFELSVVFILIGLAIAEIVLRIGRGAQVRFRLLALGCYILAVLVGDVLFPSIYYNIDLLSLFKNYMVMMLSGLSGIISIGLRLFGALISYNQSV